MYECCNLLSRLCNSSPRHGHIFLVYNSLHAFKIMFVALFFVSVGMLIDLQFLKENALIIYWYSCDYCSYCKQYYQCSGNRTGLPLSGVGIMHKVYNYVFYFFNQDTFSFDIPFILFINTIEEIRVR
jgi:hypothetical protein